MITARNFKLARCAALLFVSTTTGVAACCDEQPKQVLFKIDYDGMFQLSKVNDKSSCPALWQSSF